MLALLWAGLEWLQADVLMSNLTFVQPLPVTVSQASWVTRGLLRLGALCPGLDLAFLVSQSPSENTPLGIMKRCPLCTCDHVEF